MRNIYFWLWLSCMIPSASYGQLSLTIEVNGLRNNQGQVLLELCNEHETRITGVTRKISDTKALIVIDNLKPGKYAFKFFHDANKNGILDVNWMGIPREGFGFSNNPCLTFGPPSFKKTIFELKETKKIHCKPIYF